VGIGGAGQARSHKGLKIKPLAGIIAVLASVKIITHIDIENIAVRGKTSERASRHVVIEEQIVFHTRIESSTQILRFYTGPTAQELLRVIFCPIIGKNTKSNQN
jgi:hypothetical protein